MGYGDDGTAAFVGLERVVGKVGDRSGSFVLQHTGTFDGEDREGEAQRRARAPAPASSPASTGEGTFEAGLGSDGVRSLELDYERLASRGPAGTPWSLAPKHRGRSHARRAPVPAASSGALRRVGLRGTLQRPAQNLSAHALALGPQPEQRMLVELRVRNRTGEGAVGRHGVERGRP